MKPEDPNFPEEIPAIPEPRDKMPWSDLSSTPLSPTDEDGEGVEEAGKKSTNELASVDASTEDWMSATNQAHNPDQWSELDESDPPHLTHSSDKDFKEVEPASAMRGAGSTDAEQREAEKPVGVVPAYDDWVEEEVPYQPKELGVIDQFLLLLADGAVVWRRFLRWVRTQLPANLQRQLPDEILTAILLGLLMLVLALWNPLGRKPVPPAVVMDEPPAEVTAPPTLEPAALPVPDGGATAPAPALPLEIAPRNELEPEQTRIAEIQTQVSRISRAYGAGLIQSVEVNLPENALSVNLGENWYGLLQAQQDRVAQELYERAQELGFDTLHLRDPEGVVVARNPLVGPHAVVLKRRRSADADWPVS
ncbi:MAG: hypothetical protein HC929_02280 [Leptolyngbyaceae cyanobacterium SM2_5_2]|nr:hypothetical protein [Leptolyngbyaceae cyanobacterium SM2_5_2]